MEVLRFEIWRENTKPDETEYEAPLTRNEALDALQEENPLWKGKLTVKDSKIGLRGTCELDTSQTYVLRLADGAGRKSCVYVSKAIFQLSSAESSVVIIAWACRCFTYTIWLIVVNIRQRASARGLEQPHCALQHCHTQLCSRAAT